MKYSHETLHKLLLRMQSLDYPGYKDATELDMLAHLLTREQIIDYHEVEWSYFCPQLSEGGLEEFVGRIIPREETIRVLAFLRDNARCTIFSYNQFSPQVEPFEKECARLIHQNLVHSQRDRVCGDVALWPRPNLRRIAQGIPFKPKMSEDDQIIIKHLPSYPHYIGAFPPERIIFVAHEFTEVFLTKAALFQSTQDKGTMPPMSQAAYIDPIRYRLMQLADRYMYFDKEPAYQVLWVMGVLLLSNPKKYWCREKFAQGIVDYLNITQDFRNTKPQMDAAVAEIRHQTQPQLPFDIIAETTQADAPTIKRNGSKAMVEQLADILKSKAKEALDSPSQPVDLGKFIYAENVYIDTNNAPIIADKTPDSATTQSSPTQKENCINAGIMAVHQAHLCKAADWAVVSRILEEKGTWQRNAFTAHAEYINNVCGENVTSSTSLSRSPIYTKVAGEYPNWTIRPSEQNRETAGKLQDYLKIGKIFTDALER